MTSATDSSDFPRAAEAKALADMGRAVLTIEARTVASQVDRIDSSFVAAARTILKCTGRVVVLGMGKSGHIGGKIAATLASTGTPAFFMGDALAIALLQARGFTEGDFARAHPGGSLGRRLLLKIDDVMHSKGDMPQVSPDAPVADALVEMTRSGLGLTAVTESDDRVLGIFTDGDLRRVVERGDDLRTATLRDLMTVNCTTIQRDLLAAEALRIMQDEKINALLVVDDQQHLIGVLNMHDLLLARVL